MIGPKNGSWSHWQALRSHIASKTQSPDLAQTLYVGVTHSKPGTAAFSGPMSSTLLFLLFHPYVLPFETEFPGLVGRARSVRTVSMRGIMRKSTANATGCITPTVIKIGA